MHWFLRFSPNGSQLARVLKCGVLAAVLNFGLMSAARHVSAQAVTSIRIDASAPYSSPPPALYDGGTSQSPSGDVIGVTTRYLTLDGKPWLPVMGEFHFSRYPRDQWEEEILKMKAAGVNIIASYVIWIHHEEIQGQFDWSGQRDLRAFAELCAKHHMLLLARIGPWDHGEVRNGGFPDWVLKQGATRENDPVYLASVRALYGQIGEQLKGLLWKDGGPVIGIQLENEYAKRGPGAGNEHILELKKIAIQSGLDVPLYVITGWDDAAVPERAVIPVYGGYPSAPWDASTKKLPPAEVYAFRFQSRIAANVNSAHDQDPPGSAKVGRDSLPYLTAEMGGGNEDTYHRRPVIQPDDVAAIVPVMLGSGVNLYGTYMFQGGENPDGSLTTLQESQETGFPNDVPIKSYDFQAPLGEFGQERASFRKLKVLQYFLDDFGSDLAPMTAHAPDSLPRDPSDLSVPRSAVRSKGDSGFIFFNNYVRGAHMPERHAAQFQIRLPDSMLAVPRHPVDLPSGTYFIWPFNLHAAGVTLRYSTAQLFTRIENGGVTTLYFQAIPGIPAEFAFDPASVRSLHAANCATEHTANAIDVTAGKPGIDAQIELISSNGSTIRFVVLTQQEAEDAWKVRIAGSDHLLITGADFFADPHATPVRLWLHSAGSPHFSFVITPPLASSLTASLPLTRAASGPNADRFSASAAPRNLNLEIRSLKAAGTVPPVKLGPIGPGRPQGVAEAPPAGDLPQAAKWAIVTPRGAAAGLSELYLDLTYQGDLARFSAGDRLLTDNFFNGRPWTIGLKRFLQPGAAGTFELSILPLRSDAPVYFELPHPLSFAPNGEIGKLVNARLIPEYQLEITPASR
jgi:beta-galactosidase